MNNALSHHMPSNNSGALRTPRCCDRVSDTMLLELVQTDLRVPPFFLPGKGAELAVDHIAESDFEDIEAAPEGGGDLNVPCVEPQSLVLVAVAGSEVGGDPVAVEQACQLSVPCLLPWCRGPGLCSFVDVSPGRGR